MGGGRGEAGRKGVREGKGREAGQEGGEEGGILITDPPPLPS